MARQGNNRVLTENGWEEIYPKTSAKLVHTNADTTVEEELTKIKKSFAAILELSLNEETYVLTASLKSPSGKVLSSTNIDFPIEQLVSSWDYDEKTNEAVVTLKNGKTTRFPLDSLVAGLAKKSDIPKVSQFVLDIPTPTEEEVDYFLKGDGTWVNVFDTLGEAIDSLYAFLDENYINLYNSEQEIKVSKTFLAPMYVGYSSTSVDLSKEGATVYWDGFYISNGDTGYTRYTLGAILTTTEDGEYCTLLLPKKSGTLATLEDIENTPNNGIPIVDSRGK